MTAFADGTGAGSARAATAPESGSSLTVVGAGWASTTSGSGSAPAAACLGSSLAACGSGCSRVSSRPLVTGTGPARSAGTASAGAAAGPGSVRSGLAWVAAGWG